MSGVTQWNVAFSKQTVEEFILLGLLLQVLVTIERPQ